MPETEPRATAAAADLAVAERIKHRFPSHFLVEGELRMPQLALPTQRLKQMMHWGLNSHQNGGHYLLQQQQQQQQPRRREHAEERRGGMKDPRRRRNGRHRPLRRALRFQHRQRRA